MPTPTYTPLATVTLGTSASSVTFSSIPATYRDLVFVMNGSNSGNDYARYQFNGDTGSNYSVVDMGATANGSIFSFSFTTNNPSVAGYTANQRYFGTLQIMDYSATDKHKPVLNQETGNEGGLVLIRRATRWANTAAINSLRIFTTTGNINAGTTLSLYGIAS
jgi:hypothetical protein